MTNAQQTLALSVFIAMFHNCEAQGRPLSMELAFTYEWFNFRSSCSSAAKGTKGIYTFCTLRELHSLKQGHVFVSSPIKPNIVVWLENLQFYHVP